MNKSCLFLFIFINVFVEAKVQQSSSPTEECTGSYVRIGHLETNGSLNQTCGGALLSSRFVLTAARCKSERLEFKIEVAYNGERKLHDVDKFYFHPEFKEIGSDNDVGIILLEKEIQSLSDDEFIKLPVGGITKPVDQYCPQSLAFEYQISEHYTSINCVGLPLISTQECKETYEGNNITSQNNILCISNEDILERHLGDPLFCNGELIGILSSPRSSKNISVYTMVNDYHDFINDVIQDNDLFVSNYDSKNEMETGVNKSHECTPTCTHETTNKTITYGSKNWGCRKNVKINDTLELPPGLFNPEYVPFRPLRRSKRTKTSDDSFKAFVNNLVMNQSSLTSTDVPQDENKTATVQFRKKKTKIPYRPRMMGAQECSHQKYPFLVTIGLKTKLGDKEPATVTPLCGGTLLTAKHVLTAAHCYSEVYENDGEVVVITYTNITYHVSAFYTHQNFSLATLLNDIGVAELSQAVEVTNADMFIKIPREKLAKPFEEGCPEPLMIGYGKVGENSGYPDKLFCMNIKAITLDKCRDELKQTNWKVTKNQVCTFEKGKDACQGDAGGPLMCEGEQWGIISYGMECGKPSYPGVNTRVDAYLDSIMNFKRVMVRHGLSKGYQVSLFAWSIFMCSTIIVIICF